MGKGREDGAVSNPREQQCPLPITHPAGRRWVGQEMGRAGGWPEPPPAPSRGTFPAQRARSPEREKEKAEGLGK